MESYRSINKWKREAGKHFVQRSKWKPMGGKRRVNPSLSFSYFLAKLSNFHSRGKRSLNFQAAPRPSPSSCFPDHNYPPSVAPLPEPAAQYPPPAFLDGRFLSLWTNAWTEGSAASLIRLPLTLPTCYFRTNYYKWNTFDQFSSSIKFWIPLYELPFYVSNSPFSRIVLFLV